MLVGEIRFQTSGRWEEVVEVGFEASENGGGFSHHCVHALTPNSTK